MSELLLPLISNSVVALLLGLGALYVWRRRGWPLLAHALALLGLLKLLTPPLIGPTWSLSSRPEPVQLTSAELLQLLQSAPLDPDAAGSVGSATTGSGLTWPGLEEVLLGLWALGSLATGLLAWHRHRRMSLLLARLDPAPATVREVADGLATALGLRRTPILRVTTGRISPFVYAMRRRPVVVLPNELLDDDRALRATLAHELAHLAGRDHLVRWLELVVSVLHWWNPAAHLLRATLREVEEVRCDIRAVEALGTSPKRYGRVLLDTAERFEMPSMPVGAHALGGGHPLSRRIVALARGGLRSRLGSAGRLGLILLTGAALPLGARDRDARAGEEDEVEFVVLDDSGLGFDFDFDFEDPSELELGDELFEVETVELEELTNDLLIELEELDGEVLRVELSEHIREALSHARASHGHGHDHDHEHEHGHEPRTVRSVRSQPRTAEGFAVRRLESIELAGADALESVEAALEALHGQGILRRAVTTGSSTDASFSWVARVPGEGNTVRLLRGVKVGDDRSDSIAASVKVLIRGGDADDEPLVLRSGNADSPALLLVDGTPLPGGVLHGSGGAATYTVEAKALSLPKNLKELAARARFLTEFDLDEIRVTGTLPGLELEFGSADLSDAHDDD